MNPTKRILLLRPDKAGDALKTLPVLRRAIGINPHWQWHVLASPYNASVFENEPNIQLHVLPKQWEELNRDQFLKASRLDLPFDVAISLLCDSFDYSHQILCHTLAEKKFGVGPSPRLQWEVRPLQSGPAGRCESQNIATLLDQALDLDLGGDFENAPPVLSDSDREEAKKTMGAKDGLWIGFCPFAGTENRSQPLERWRSFIQRTVESSPAHFRFFLFAGPDQGDRLRDWQRSTAQPDRVSVCCPSSFRTLGAYLRRLDGVVAVDSGPLHLARSLNVPSLGILSGGDWKRWFPNQGPNDHLVRRGLLDRFPSTGSMRRALARWSRQLGPMNPLPS